MTIIGSVEWQQRHDPREVPWHILVRDKARSLTQDYCLWNTNKWKQPEALTDEFVTALEIFYALSRLRREHPKLFAAILVVDLERPFPKGVDKTPAAESRRKYSLGRASRVMGIAPRTVEYRCQIAWGWVVKYINDECYAQAMTWVSESNREGWQEPLPAPSV